MARLPAPHRGIATIRTTRTGTVLATHRTGNAAPAATMIPKDSSGTYPTNISALHPLAKNGV